MSNIPVLIHKALHALGTLTAWTAGLFVVFYFLERWDGAEPGRYWSRHFATDLLYRLFYGGGIIRLFIYVPLAAVLHLQGFPQPLVSLDRIPGWILLPTTVLLSDFLGYWLHRFEHSRYWWRFHRVHHSQEHLTFLTGYRHHPFDWILGDSMTLILILLGAPTIAWLPYRLFSTFQGAASHAELHWKLGPVRYLFVSPVFHSIHHSTDRQSFDRNFGQVLSLWDYLFGTASSLQERPARTGITDDPLPENIALQVVMPVAELFAAFRRSEPSGSDVRG
ncbi:MAG: sterol desaturase family protein [Gemmatimonadota bacterium]